VTACREAENVFTVSLSSDNATGIGISDRYGSWKITFVDLFSSHLAKLFTVVWRIRRVNAKSVESSSFENAAHTNGYANCYASCVAHHRPTLAIDSIFHEIKMQEATNVSAWNVKRIQHMSSRRTKPTAIRQAQFNDKEEREIRYDLEELK